MLRAAGFTPVCLRLWPLSDRLWLFTHSGAVMPRGNRPWEPPRGYDTASSGCPAIQLYNSLVDEKRVSFAV